MRRSFNSEWLLNEQGEVMGFNLGADYCAEHEWGIKNLNQMLKITDENPMGIDSRKSSFSPENVFFKKTANKAILIINDNYYINQYNQSLKHLPQDLKKSHDGSILTSWDNGSLGIAAFHKEDIVRLTNLFLALQRNDLALWVGNRAVFRNGGLYMMEVSKVSEINKTQMLNHDLEMNKKIANA